MLVDSTRRKSLIHWQKRAAAWEHGFALRQSGIQRGLNAAQAAVTWKPPYTQRK